jgi:hypothetical protein
MTCGMFGNYRIDDIAFPAPATSWEEQPIAAGLNGLSINSAYRIHRWTWSGLEASVAKQVFQKFDALQAAGEQPASLETDPYDASTADENYGTVTYTDVIVRELSPRTRGLPFFDNISILFEIFVA